MLERLLSPTPGSPMTPLATGLCQALANDPDYVLAANAILRAYWQTMQNPRDGPDLGAKAEFLGDQELVRLIVGEFERWQQNHGAFSSLGSALPDELRQPINELA